MKVCIVQHDIVWQNPEENIRRMEARLDRAPQADLYVLAEMWATGFGDAPTVSLEAGLWMRQMSREMKAALAGSLAVEDGGVVHNRLLFVKPDSAKPVPVIIAFKSCVVELAFWFKPVSLSIASSALYIDAVIRIITSIIPTHM